METQSQKICLNCKHSRIELDCDDPSTDLTCWAPQNTRVSLITGETVQKGEPSCAIHRAAEGEDNSIRCCKQGNWFQPMDPVSLSTVTDAIAESIDDAATVGKKLVQEIFSFWS